jgi:vancomycin resistance protein YoaR
MRLLRRHFYPTRKAWYIIPIMETPVESSTAPEKLQAQPAKPRNSALRVLAVVLAAAATLVFSSALSAPVYQQFNNGKIYPGVSVYGVDLSGLTAAEAAQRISLGFTYPWDGRITFQYREKTWVATPADLGLRLDLLTTVNNAYAVGRSKDLLGNLEDQTQARFIGVAVPPVLQYDFGKALVYLQGVAAEVDQPAQEAKLEMDLNNMDVVAIPGQMGKQIDIAAMYGLIADPIGHLKDAVIPLDVTEYPPDVMDATPQAETARNLLSQDFALTIENSLPGDPPSWLLTPSMLADMLTFRKVKDTTGTHYLLALDEGKLANLLMPLAAPLSRKVANARYLFNESTRQLDLYIPSQPGRELNVEKTIRSIQDAVSQGAHGAPLGFDFAAPEIGDAMDASALGITELLPQGMGTQWTSFSGSSNERIHNITLASGQFNGVLVKPGAEFSMGEQLGDVSLDTGYSEALIIINGATVKGAGGGVCQVSTTLFRMAFMAGYPITMRYAHAYRVGYYENGDGPVHLGAGFDATVFLPDVDLKFINDSDHWLLMETEVDLSTKRLYWRFYSTYDGRSVNYNAVVTNEKPQPDPKWEPNPNLAPNEYKQVEWQAPPGEDVTVSRTVSRDGQVISQKTFPTHYLPWGNVCQYNPDTPPPEGASCPP